MYFEGNNVDSDAMRGLLDLLEAADDWALVVISKSGGTLETAVAFRVFLQALRRACGNDHAKFRQRIVAITGQTGKLRSLVGRLGLSAEQVFDIPDGIGGRFSVFTPVGLLPAAILGLDVAALLEGAAAMNARFRREPVLDCPPLAYAGMSHLMELRRGASIRVLATWGKRLEAVGLWYDQLLAESLGKQGVGVTPLTVVNTRDLHSRGQQHQEGSRDKLITNLYVEQCQREPLSIERWETDEDGLNKYAGKTVADVLAAAFTGTNEAYAADGRRTATIRLPRLDEFAVGQLLQMLMIATVVEGKLIGINPYGQPGVEAYKQRMVAILQR
jgi:glucose-6-phosphate isomerase